MSIQYNALPTGGFGNRLFQMNFLGQLSKHLDTEFNFFSPTDYRYIENVRSWRAFGSRFSKNKALDANFFEGDKNEVLGELARLHTQSKKIVIQGSFLGDYFFDYCTFDPREIVKVKEFIHPEKAYVSMHFRGTDFHTWNAEAILKANYYLKSLDYIDHKIGRILPVRIVTDDPSLPNLLEVLSKISHRASVYSSTKSIDDFKTLIGSTALISSPSTFAIWGGILGEQKLITHSRRWVEQRVEAEDKFWIQLFAGGNERYNCVFISD